MTAAPARLPAPGDPAALTRHLDAIAAALDGYGVGYQVTRPAGTPILTTGPPAGPGAATVAIDPDMHAGPDPQLDCTCVWTPAPDTSPETTAAVIAAVLAATRPAWARPAVRLPPPEPGWPPSWAVTPAGPPSGTRGTGCGAPPKTTPAPPSTPRPPTPPP